MRTGELRVVYLGTDTTATRVNPTVVYMKFPNIVLKYCGQWGRKDNQNPALFDLIHRTVSSLTVQNALNFCVMHGWDFVFVLLMEVADRPLCPTIWQKIYNLQLNEITLYGRLSYEVIVGLKKQYLSTRLLQSLL